jgi:hypothetical protein
MTPELIIETRVMKQIGEAIFNREEMRKEEVCRWVCLLWK